MAAVLLKNHNLVFFLFEKFNTGQKNIGLLCSKQGFF